jgi:hypothetical protein
MNQDDDDDDNDDNNLAKSNKNSINLDALSNSINYA